MNRMSQTITTKQISDFVNWIMKTEAWRNDGALKLYLYCLANASHNEYEWYGRHLHPGDLPLSERHVSEALGWSRNKLRRKMTLLKNMGLITVQSSRGHLNMVHVVNWPDSEPGAVQSEAYTEEDEPGGYPVSGLDRPENSTTPAQNQPHNHIYQNQSGFTTAHNPYDKGSSYVDSKGYGYGAEPDGFDEIWRAYPEHRRTRRREAAALVAKALEEGATVDSIRTAVEMDKFSPDWQTNDGQYVPGIVKWLQRESWRSHLPESRPDIEETDEMWLTR